MSRKVDRSLSPDAKALWACIENATGHGRRNAGTVFADFLEMACCALTGGRQEPEYLAVVGRYAERDCRDGKRGCDWLADAFGLLCNTDGATDVLGETYEAMVSYGEHGQFFTPENVCAMMAMMQVEGVGPRDDGEPVRIADTCCGSGRMLLAAAKHAPAGAEFHGTDIDARCERMAALNLALRGIDGVVLCRNGLTDEAPRFAYRTGWRMLVRHGAAMVPMNVADDAPETQGPPPGAAEPTRRLPARREPVTQGTLFQGVCGGR